LLNIEHRVHASKGNYLLVIVATIGNIITVLLFFDWQEFPEDNPNPFFPFFDLTAELLRVAIGKPAGIDKPFHHANRIEQHDIQATIGPVGDGVSMFSIL